MAYSASRPRHRTRLSLLLLAAALLIGACQSIPQPADRLAILLADPDRATTDRQRDAAEKPGEVLALLGLETGDAVLDLFAGGGYYSELLAHAVGFRGEVWAHNNSAYLRFAEPALSERLSRLEPSAETHAPVTNMLAEIGELPLADNSIDAAIIMLTYHDVYFVSDGWAVTAEPVFADLRRVLKPGGRLLIVDHVAASGRGKDDAQDIHRIEPAFARADITARGFSYLAESDVLRNSEDNLSVSVFDPSVRGRTDKFVMVFTRD